MFGKKEVPPPQGFSSRSQGCAQNPTICLVPLHFLSLLWLLLCSCRCPVDYSHSSWFALDCTFLLFSGAKCRCKRTESDFLQQKQHKNLHESVFFCCLRLLQQESQTRVFIKSPKLPTNVKKALLFEVEMSRVEYDHLYHWSQFIS